MGRDWYLNLGKGIKARAPAKVWLGHSDTARVALGKASGLVTGTGIEKYWEQATHGTTEIRSGPAIPTVYGVPNPLISLDLGKGHGIFMAASFRMQEPQGCDITKWGRNMSGCMASSARNGSAASSASSHLPERWYCYILSKLDFGCCWVWRVGRILLGEACILAQR